MHATEVLCPGLTLVLQMYIPLVLSLVFACVVLYTWRRSVPPNCMHGERRGGRGQRDGGRGRGREACEENMRLAAICLSKFGACSTAQHSMLSPVQLPLTLDLTPDTHCCKHPLADMMYMLQGSGRRSVEYSRGGGASLGMGIM